MLLVDDDDAFRELARRLVSSWGHDVEEAATVAQALERADALRPHTDADAGRGRAVERAGAIAFFAKERLTGTAFRELIEPR